MACSKYTYVKQFETLNTLLPNTYIVIRIDGKGFHKFTALNEFAKPNEYNALKLMNKAAQEVMVQFREIFIAYGQSDEYSFVFRKKTQIYNRRGEKILSTLVSCFTANYILHYEEFLGKKMKGIPTFDGRWILYPEKEILKDYLSWRQVDCHINNLYNTTFWLLVQKDGITNVEAEKILKDTNSGQKNELMFQKGINYNNQPEIFKKGSIIIWMNQENEEKQKNQQHLVQLHEDLIQITFWDKYKQHIDF